jgi:hypothetical protein
LGQNHQSIQHSPESGARKTLAFCHLSGPVSSPFVGEPCVVVASSRWRDGRKIDAHSALYTSEGEPLAAARAVWIDVTPGGAR